MKTPIKTQSIVIAAGVLLSAALFAGSFYRVVLLIPAQMSWTACLAVLFWSQARRGMLQHKQELERVSTALRESEQRFRVIFDQAAGMGMITPSGEWLSVNSSLCALLGYSESELLE